MSLALAAAPRTPQPLLAAAAGAAAGTTPQAPCGAAAVAEATAPRSLAAAAGAAAGTTPQAPCGAAAAAETAPEAALANAASVEATEAQHSASVDRGAAVAIAAQTPLAAEADGRDAAAPRTAAGDGRAPAAPRTAAGDGRAPAAPCAAADDGRAPQVLQCAAVEAPKALGAVASEDGGRAKVLAAEQQALPRQRGRVAWGENVEEWLSGRCRALALVVLVRAAIVLLLGVLALHPLEAGTVRASLQQAKQLLVPGAGHPSATRAPLPRVLLYRLYEQQQDQGLYRDGVMHLREKRLLVALCAVHAYSVCSVFWHAYQLRLLLF